MGTTIAASIAMQAAAAGLSAIDNRQQAKTANRFAAAEAATKTAHLKRNQEIEKRRRQDQLKRDTATQRARFSAQGTGARGGSAAAVLQGLARPVDEAIKDSQLLSQSSINAINENLRHRKKTNLLDASKPLRRFAFNTLAKHGASLLD